MGKTIQEMLDSLSKEQQKPFIDHFIKKILGKPTGPLISSKGLTMSNDLQVLEQIRHLADNFGVDPDSIDYQEWSEGIRLYEDSKTGIKSIIDGHYDYNNLLDAESRKKNNEILELGKFLYTTEQDLQFTPKERPDFILTKEGLTIGLELTLLQAEKESAFDKEVTKKYVSPVVMLILNSFPDLRGLINLTLDLETPFFEGKALRDFKAAQIKKITPSLCKEIAEYIIGIVQGKNVILPEYIASLSYQAGNETFGIRHNMQLIARPDFTDLLRNAIDKKEKLLAGYKAESVVDEWWLLLVFNDGMYSSSFKVVEHSVSIKINSQFDRTFILNGFDLACYELRTEMPYLLKVSNKQLKELRASKKQ